MLATVHATPVDQSVDQLNSRTNTNSRACPTTTLITDTIE